MHRSWLGKAMPNAKPASAEITVTPSTEAITAYGNSVGFGLPDANPAGAPTHFLAMTWLSMPPIRQLVADACPAGTLPMQTSQFVEMGADLFAGETLTVTAAISASNGQLQLSYTATDQAGKVRTRGEIGFVCVTPDDLDRILQ
jgi:hypothetical protein